MVSLLAASLLAGACDGGDGGGATATAKSQNYGPAKITRFKIVAGQEKETSRTEFTYDTEGKVTTTRFFDLEKGASSLTLVQTTSYTYNSDGKTSSSQARLADSTSVFDYNMTYVDGVLARQVETINWSDGDVEVNTDSHTYKDGRLMSTKMMGKGFVFARSFTYDSNGRALTAHFGDSESWSDDGWTYESSGRLKQADSSFKDKDAGSDAFFYDGQGWLSRIDEGSTVQDHVRQYVRDMDGLLKEVKVKLTDGTLVEVLRYDMVKEGSAHFWSRESGENYPVNLERLEIFGGARPNLYEKQ